MANEKRLIAENDVYALFDKNGTARLHVGDIDVLPRVDAVEVVHGEWHDVYLMTPWIATGICSHCNLKSYINPDFPFAKYCPYCGAKMDGERRDGE